MAKENKTYRCSACGHTVTRWLGRCPIASCKEYNSYEEVASTANVEAAAKSGLKTGGSIKPVTKAKQLKEIDKTPVKRTRTGIEEFDRVLGGGFVDGEVLLFAGQPGAGKSTLSLEISNRMAKQGKKVLYVSGEESEGQIGLRAQRMEIDHENIHIVHEVNLETILGHIEEEAPEFFILDSIQTISSSSDDIKGSVGGITQSNAVAHELTRLAKRKNIIMVLINQVIKSGEFAGSESIKHIVDAAFMLESDQDSPLKFLRASKNRFGDVTEVGVFQHNEKGLQEVADPSGVFLDDENDGYLSGTACSFITEGVRQMPIEVQALVVPSSLTNPRKQFNGVQFQRCQIVCAILDKFNNAKLFENDVFVSTVSGVKVLDPQADLAIAVSIYTSLKESLAPKVKTAFVGELSLTGQVRGAFMIENKIKEAERLGFERIVIPSVSLKNLSNKKRKIEIVGVSSVKELEKILKK